MQEWSARRIGRRGLSTEASRASVHVVGRIGLGTTAAWDLMESGQKAYLESFDRRLPPSLHISERDRLRANMPIPTAERCIEDWQPRDKTSRVDSRVRDRTARREAALAEFEALRASETSSTPDQPVRPSTNSQPSSS